MKKDNSKKSRHELDVKPFQIEADIFAEILPHRNCSEAFRKVFDNIFFGLMLNEVDFSHPEFVRNVYAPVRAWLENNSPATSEALHQAMLSMHEVLNPKEVKDAARAVAKGGAR